MKRVMGRNLVHNWKPIHNLIAKCLTLNLDPCPKTDDDKEKMSNIRFASVIGSLMYTMSCT